MVHDLDAMAAKVGPNTKAVYICNPNNPTSTIVPPAKLKAFCIEMSKKVPVFIDEAYLECSDNFAENTMAPLVAAGHNIVVARTFSKMYGLAGQRVGYGLMPAAIAKEVAALSETRLNKLGVLAATASIEEMTYVPETRAKIKAERDKLCATLKELKRKFPDPQGNFVFFHTGMPIKTFQEKMAAENVMVARAFPPALDWCRMSIGSPEEMALAHAALRKIFA
jgi:histidinol-phosphate aminotransferase